MKRMLNQIKMKILSGVMLGAVLLFAAGTVQAQDDGGKKKDRKGKISGGFGYFSSGYTNLDMQPLNNFLNAADNFEFSNDQFLLGGGGFMIVRNLIIGGEGHTVTQQVTENDVQRVNHSGGWGQFQVGYVVFSRRGFLLYPRVGIGGYNHRLEFINSSAAGTNASNLVGTPTTAGSYTGTEITRNGMLLSGEIGMAFMPGFDETSGSGATIGLNIGYNYAATQKPWNAYDVNLIGGPDIDITGLYVKLTVGFGGWHRQ